MIRFLLLALLLFAAPAWAQRPPALVPASADTVLERLPKGYAAVMPTRTRSNTDPLMQIQQLLATASSTGDARLAARADGLLQRISPTNTNPEILRARAFSAQHRHDFALSLRILDQLIAQDPRDGDARLARAQINLLQGRLDRARSDCVSLALGVDAGRGLICVAALSLRTGNYPAAARVLDRWIMQSPPADPARRYVLVMRAEIASRSSAPDADTWYRRALALGRNDVRTLSSYARYLRGQGRDREVLALLQDIPEHDGLQLQRALAAQASGHPAARRLADMQARRYATARAAGYEPELRDEAEFMLVLRRDPATALRLAQRNFETQRDVEDVSILQRAAAAAQRPQALQPLRQWARSQKLVLDDSTGNRR